MGNHLADMVEDVSAEASGKFVYYCRDAVYINTFYFIFLGGKKLWYLRKSERSLQSRQEKM